MRILASGASGTIGSALLPGLKAQGHEVIRLKTRAARRADEIAWKPSQPIDPGLVNGFDAVIHLAGENVFGRWTPRKKAAIRDSRVQGTRNLSQALAQAAQKPRVLLAGSAIGFYGSRGDEVLTEESPVGRGFLAEVTSEWEAATKLAAEAGIRVVNLRTSVVLSPKGGALAKMLPPFRLGLGGKIGSGRQWMSWIAIDDEVGAIVHLLNDHSFSGQVNLTAPHPATNAEFARTLGRVLRRPVIATVPSFAVKLVLGSEMAEETVLSSQKVMPARLIASGYKFKQPELEPALRSLLETN